MSQEQDVMALEQRRREAMTQADVVSLSSMFDDDMMWIHATARVDTKPGLLSSIETGSTKYLAIDCSDETVRIFEDKIAIISGIADITAEIKGEHRVLQNRFTIIWQLKDAGWKVVNWQSTTVRKP